MWSFSHAQASDQLLGDNRHNQRRASATFGIGASSLVHGLAGYFDAVLYGSVELSIRPDTHTEDMHSWFPMYFPIKHPMVVSPGDGLTVHMWRRSRESRTWYEWAVESSKGEASLSSLVHNINAHEYWIGH
ncbi:hypothetical protein GGI10_004412 [Coemansia sp. RSA 2530]|nr:hypothetical protein GGI10_004412 [Coemansia sp. RSA 2530]